MNFLPGLVLKIGKATVPPEQGIGTMSIIIQRRYVHLEEEMLGVFGEQEDVNLIVDRRYGERRASQQHFAVERRCADQRTSKEPVVEVVLSIYAK
jgi:hypothetical protein